MKVGSELAMDSIQSRDSELSGDPPPPGEGDTPDGRYTVEYDTESVVSGFMCHLYEHVHSRQEYDDSPYTHEFHNLRRRDSLSVEIGRRLANIGDEMYEKHGSDMDYLILSLRPSKDNVFRIFSEIASKTMAGGMNWGRVLALLCFGFRLLIKAMGFGLPPGSISSLVASIAQVFILKKITHWVARNGGWGACLNFNPSASHLAMAVVILGGVASVLAAVYKSLS